MAAPQFKPMTALRPPPAPEPSAGPRAAIPAPLTTSERLKHDLADTHTALEHLMQLPHAIKTVQDYAATLKMYLNVFAPLEDALAQQRRWTRLGIDFEQHRRTPALQADILALTGAPHTATPPKSPPFARFSEAFGALYVLEGSVLGGRFILHDLDRRLGPAIAGARNFFEGRGAQTGPFWHALKQKLDAYGALRPDQYQWLAAGARLGFERFMHAAKSTAE